MSREILEQVVARAVGDAAFRQLLRTNPTAALREFRLTPDERAALTSGDPAKLVSLGIDQRMSRLVLVPDQAVGAFRTAPESDVTAAAGVDIDAGASGISASAVTPGESLTQTNLRLVEGRLDTLGGPEIHAGDSLPADYGRVAGEAGRSGLARIEGDLDTTQAAATADTAGIEGLSRLREGAETGVAGVGGTWRLREGTDAVAGDATPAGEAPFRTDILPDHEAAPSAVQSDQWPGDSLPAGAMDTESAGVGGTWRLREGTDAVAGDATPAGAVGGTEAGELDMTMIDAGLTTQGTPAYAPESGTYDFTARDFEGAETGDVQAVEDVDHIEGLHRMREIEGSDQSVDTTTTTEGGDQITE